MGQIVNLRQIVNLPLPVRRQSSTSPPRSANPSYSGRTREEDEQHGKTCLRIEPVPSRCYVDPLKLGPPAPAAFSHFIEQARSLTGLIYGCRTYEIMRLL